MLFRKTVHELSRFYIGSLLGRPIVFTASAVPHSQDENPPCYSTTHFPLSRHPHAQTTCDLKSSFLWQVAFFPESVKYRLSSVESTQKLFRCDINACCHDSFSLSFSPKSADWGQILNCELSIISKCKV